MLEKLDEKPKYGNNGNFNDNDGNSIVFDDIHGPVIMISNQNGGNNYFGKFLGTDKGKTESSSHQSSQHPGKQTKQKK